MQIKWPTVAICLLVFYIYTVLSGKGFSGSSTDPYCGGTILNENTILTAARCFGNQDDQIKIKGGFISAGILQFEDAVWDEDKDYLESEIGHQHVKIEKIESHSNLFFDAAIVKLVRSLKFNSAVKPACLPDPDFESETGIISGWEFSKNTEGNDY